MILRDINENEAETNQDTLDNVIEECPDITSTGMMEDCGNEELVDRNKNGFNEENKTCLNDQ